MNSCQLQSSLAPTFLLSSKGFLCRRGKGGGQHTRQTLEKSPTSKLYTTWAHILSDRNKFALRGEGENGGVQCPRGFSCIIFHFLGGHLPQTSGFCSAKLLVASFATQARACILSDHNIFYTPKGGGNGGVMPLGLFFLPRRQDGIW